jgi:hypothetical protein
MGFYYLHVVIDNSRPFTLLIKPLVVFKTVCFPTYFYIIVDTQRGYHTLELKRQLTIYTAAVALLELPKHREKCLQK